MEDWQTGDSDAFQALFQQYERLVFTNAYFITGNRYDTEEVVQEVFVSVWKSRLTYQPEKGKLSTWLHRITVNKCLERQRKMKPVAISLENVDVPDGDGSEEAAMDEFERERVLGAMDTLDGKHRTVLVLRYFNEMTYDEIAHTMGIPIGTVKSRMYVAMQTLRKQLGAQQGEAST